MLGESTDRHYDLSDNLFQTALQRTFYLGVEIANPRWPVWDEETVEWVANRIIPFADDNR